MAQETERPEHYSQRSSRHRQRSRMGEIQCRRLGIRPWQLSLTSHKVPVLGCFIWMKNSANEAKRMWLETGHLNDQIDYMAMDSKADDYDLFREMDRQRKVTLVTSCRKDKVVSENRQRMFKVMEQPKHKQIYKERSYRVEPMQGLVKDIFELDRCWMRGSQNNRWLFAAMGLTVQMHQLDAYKQKLSTWNIKEEVLGYKTPRPLNS